MIVSLSDFNKEQTCKAPTSLSGLFFVYVIIQTLQTSFQSKLFILPKHVTSVYFEKHY